MSHKSYTPAWLTTFHGLRFCICLLALEISRAWQEPIALHLVLQYLISPYHKTRRTPWCVCLRRDKDRLRNENACTAGFQKVFEEHMIFPKRLLFISLSILRLLLWNGSPPWIVLQAFMKEVWSAWWQINSWTKNTMVLMLLFASTILLKILATASIALIAFAPIGHNLQSEPPSANFHDSNIISSLGPCLVSSGSVYNKIKLWVIKCYAMGIGIAQGNKSRSFSWLGGTDQGCLMKSNCS